MLKWIATSVGPFCAIGPGADVARLLLVTSAIGSLAIVANVSLVSNSQIACHLIKFD